MELSLNSVCSQTIQLFAVVRAIDQSLSFARILFRTRDADPVPLLDVSRWTGSIHRIL